MKIEIRCSTCEKSIADKNEIGACKKLLGRNIKKFFCLQCLADYLDTTPEAILEKIEMFRAEGCKLFS